MESGTVVISIIAVVVCVLPFVLVYLGKQKKKKVIIEKLSSIAREHSSAITQYEFTSPRTIIGIDENKKNVFFYKNNEEKEITKFINLSDIASCKSNIGSFNGSTHTDKVQLRFISKSKDKPEVVIDLYNVEYDMHLGEEILFAEKWSKQINEMI